MSQESKNAIKATSMVSKASNTFIRTLHHNPGSCHQDHPSKEEVHKAGKIFLCDRAIDMQKLLFEGKGHAILCPFWTLPIDEAP